ncbi:MAG TPA: MarR family transcriptional regulator, partial [Methanocorpusculum sp.]|nr:MarR family transcriptional regulator [Methanocorpusculum sp.]
MKYGGRKRSSVSSLFFQGTILENVVLILIPIVSALLGVLCIGIFTSANKRIKSPVSENILLSIRENPGITQKQITDTVRCSRGSVCYHLHQLEKTGKIRKIPPHTLRKPLY